MCLVSNLYPRRIVRGPYFAKDKGRYYVQIVWESGNHYQSMHLARFLMQEHVGRLLTDEEEVDHIDENKANDDLTNLQILTPKENHNKTFRKYELEIIEQCIWCDNFFTMSNVKQRLWKNKQRAGKAGPFCTASCAAKYSAQQRLAK